MLLRIAAAARLAPAAASPVATCCTPAPAPAAIPRPCSALHREGGAVAELDLAGEGAEWRRLDTAEPGDVRRVRMWAQGTQRADCVVVVTSVAGHMDMLGRQTRPEYRTVGVTLPDADATRLRSSIEGVGRGTGDFVQQAAKFEQLALRARAEGLVLRGYSDGAMSEDRRIGAYAWLVAVQSKEGELEILAGGGGGADANDKENVLLSSTRMEALGLAAGMSYARAWTGRVEWRVDNLGVVKGFRKLRHMTPADWGRVSDRDVTGYLQLMRETAAGDWAVRHVRGHAEKRAARAEWSLDELGNDQADGVAGRVRDALVSAMSDYEDQVREWRRQVGGGEGTSERVAEAKEAVGGCCGRCARLGAANQATVGAAV